MMLEELGFSIASQRPDKYKVVEEFKEMVYPFKKKVSLYLLFFILIRLQNLGPT
jgi:hypothetical protein